MKTYKTVETKRREASARARLKALGFKLLKARSQAKLANGGFKILEAHPDMGWIGVAGDWPVNFSMHLEDVEDFVTEARSCGEPQEPHLRLV